MSSRKKLGSHLEWHNGSIRVVVAVPRALQPSLGTKLKKSLGTDSPTLAEVRKWPVIGELKAQLKGAARVFEDPLMREALEWKGKLANARQPDGPDDDDDEVGLVSVLMTTRAEEIEKGQGRQVARAFFDVASGNATPLKAHLETFLAEQQVTPRYKDDIRLAVKRLAAWCAKGDTPETLEGITRRAAGEFISKELTTALGQRKTINKSISSLSSYWRWLAKRGHLGDTPQNPWVGQSFEVQRSGGMGAEGAERAFTDEEAATLLYGPATPRMKDIMWIAALSGMRIDEVCRLQVRDCADSWFRVNARRGQNGEGKSEASRRDVPIHAALVEIVKRRSKGKPPEAPLIDGLPAPDPKGMRRPSTAAGQEFVRYRRDLGVDDVVDGKRRARVNFHSWRRWFVTTAMQAHNQPHIVSWLVGHEEGRKGMTLGVYDTRGPSQDQLRAVITSIALPKKPPADKTDSPRPDGRTKSGRTKASKTEKG